MIFNQKISWKVKIDVDADTSKSHRLNYILITLFIGIKILFNNKKHTHK